jgi:hypothetical protein
MILIHSSGIKPWRAVLIAAGLILAAPSALQARDPPVSALNPRPTMQYDIGPQPLIDALEAFGAASGIQVLYDAALAAGRGSNGVNGEQTPEEALDRVLAGSGLKATFVRSNAVYIYSGSQAVGRASNASDGGGGVAPGAVLALGALHVDAPALTIGHPRYDAYATALQLSLRQALEQTPQARHGTWTATVELDMAPDGTVRQARLATSTGDAQTDVIVRAILAAGRMPPPPQGLPQPVKVQISASGTP